MSLNHTEPIKENISSPKLVNLLVLCLQSDAFLVDYKNFLSPYKFPKIFRIGVFHPRTSRGGIRYILINYLWQPASEEQPAEDVQTAPQAEVVPVSWFVERAVCRGKFGTERGTQEYNRIYNRIHKHTIDKRITKHRSDKSIQEKLLTSCQKNPETISRNHQKGQKYQEPQSDQSLTTSLPI